MNLLPSKFEFSLIEQIAVRAVALAADVGLEYKTLDCVMDLSAAHEDVGMDLNRLLNAPNGDFGHDVFGIRRHMNRKTAKLEGCFLPRCSLHPVKEAP